MIVLDKDTGVFHEIKEVKICYVCSSDRFVDDHHIDLKHGAISDETVPLCRRCHTTIHRYGGIHWFDDEILDRAIEVWNRTKALYDKPLMTRDKIKRSDYWYKKHNIKKGRKKVVLCSDTMVFKEV